MARFHINKHGVPAPCRARLGNCPLGGDEAHFDNLEKAQTYADNYNKSKHGLLPRIQYKLIPEEIWHEKRSYVAYLNYEHFNDDNEMLNFNEIIEGSLYFDSNSHPKLAIIEHFELLQTTYENQKTNYEDKVANSDNQVNLIEGKHSNYVEKLNYLFEKDYGTIPNIDNTDNLSNDIIESYKKEYGIAEEIDKYYSEGLKRAKAVFKEIVDEDWTYMYDDQSEGVLDISTHIKENLLLKKLM